jgi:hypothetical protein
MVAEYWTAKTTNLRESPAIFRARWYCIPGVFGEDHTDFVGGEVAAVAGDRRSAGRNWLSIPILLPLSSPSSVFVVIDVESGMKLASAVGGAKLPQKGRLHFARRLANRVAGGSGRYVCVKTHSRRGRLGR